METHNTSWNDKDVKGESAQLHYTNQSLNPYQLKQSFAQFSWGDQTHNGWHKEPSDYVGWFWRQNKLFICDYNHHVVNSFTTLPPRSNMMSYCWWDFPIIKNATSWVYVITMGHRWNTVCPCALLRAGISLISVGTHPAEVWFYDKVTLNLHSVSVAASIWLKWSPAHQTDGGRDISSCLNFHV